MALSRAARTNTTSSSSAPAGTGLATAYYLAKEHGITNVAVLEKGWLGGGNTGRNTTIIRSNYLYDESAGIYDHALKLWEGLSPGPQLQRHVLAARRDDAGAQRPRRAGVQAAHPRQPPERRRQRVADAGRGEGILPAAQHLARRRAIPVMGAALQRRGGTARHDAVAWGYARAASDRGIDIIQNCEVTGVRRGGNGAGDRRRDDARLHRREEGRRRGGRPYLGADADGRRAHAARKLPAAGAGLRAGQAGASPASSCRTRCMPISRSPTRASW